MNRKFVVSVLFLFTIAASLIYAQNKVEKAKTAKNSILILKDSSRLEISVSRIIIDTLTKRGYHVKVAKLADASKENASLYKINIVFNAVKAGNEIDPRIRKFITSKGDTSSKVFLYTVYGNIFNKRGNDIDAITQATETLRPQIIANHILWTLKL